MAEETNFGYVSLEEIQKGSNSSSWKWGVNQNVFLKEIEYHAKDGDKSAYVSMSFGFEDDENTKSLIVFEPDINSHYNKSLGKRVKEGEEGFDEKYAEILYKAKLNSANRTFSNILGCFLEESKIKSAISQTRENLAKTKQDFGFAEFAKLTINGIKATNFQTVPLDIMLQYAAKLSEKGNSYLEIATADGGLFVCKHQEGEWEEEKIPMKHYKLFKKENNVKTNIKHPISRGSNAYFWNTNAEPVSIKKQADPFDPAAASTASTPAASNDIDWDI